MLALNNFKTSGGWLQRFKKRHNIVFNVLNSEAGLVNDYIVQDWNKCHIFLVYRTNKKNSSLIAGSNLFERKKKTYYCLQIKFSGHSPNKGKEPYKLTNIKLEHFIANTTSVCRPMDQGIIWNTKIHYRRRVIERKLDSIEYQAIDYQEIDVKTSIEYLV